MAEVLGKLLPDVDTSMLFPHDELSPLEHAQITQAVAERIDLIKSEAEAAAPRFTSGKFIVALEDGRVTLASYSYGLGIAKNEGEHTNG